MLRRNLLCALMTLAFAGCEHPIGVVDFPPGITPLQAAATQDLRAVFAVSDQEVYVAGVGIVGKLGGSGVERIVIPGTSDTDVYWDIAAAASGEVVAIGGNNLEAPMIVALHAGSWTIRSNPEQFAGFHPLRLASTLHHGAAEPRVILAGADLGPAGAQGTVNAYRNGELTPVQLPSTYGQLEDVSVIGASLYFRHEQGVLELMGDGSRFDLPSVPSEVNTNVLALPEGREKFLMGLAGDGSFHVFQEGADWIENPAAPLLLSALDGLAINDLYAVGQQGGFFHYDGSVWTAIDSGTTQNLRDVHVLPNGHVFVVGDGGAAFVYVP